MALGFLKRRFLRFRLDAVALWFAFRDPRTPFPLKVASLFTGLYLISPIDLIPIMVPFFGLLDDLIIVPLAVGFITKRLPEPVRIDTKRKADRWIARWFKRPLLALAIIVGVLILIWLVLLYLIIRLIFG